MKNFIKNTFYLSIAILFSFNVATGTVAAEEYDYDNSFTYDNSYSYDNSNSYVYDNSFSYDNSNSYLYDNSYTYDNSYNYDNSYLYDNSNTYGYSYENTDYVDYGYEYADYDYVDYGYTDYSYGYDYVGYNDYVVYDAPAYTTSYNVPQYTYTNYPSYNVSSSYVDNSYVDNSYTDNSYYSNNHVVYESEKRDYCDYNDCHKETKKKSVKTPSCDLEASDRSIEEGDRVTLEWEVEDADYFVLKDNRGNTHEQGTVNGDDDGRLTVKPTRDTTYTLIAENDDKERDCEVTINVDEDDEHIVVREVRTYEPTSGIYLKEAPYTGVDATTAITYAMYGLLTLWALYAAYYVAVRRSRKTVAIESNYR